MSKKEINETKEAEKEEKKESKEKKEEKKEPEENKKTSKLKTIIIVVIVFVLLLGTSIGLSLTSKKGGIKSMIIKSQVKITESEAKQVEFETYDNGLVSFQYPKGWKVEVAPFDYIHYSFKVYNPENPNYMFLFGMKLEGFNKSQAARDWQQKYYPGNLFSQLPVIDPQTTEAFFNIWNETASYVNANDAKSNYLPFFNEFTIIENLNTNEIGGDILRATYKDGNNNLVQGLFTAAVYSAGNYNVSVDIWNPFGATVDVWPLNVYNIIFMTTPDDEFINWQSILDNCLSTIQFSQTFINGFNQEENTLMQTIQANQKVYDQISDMIMDSWEKRNNSYDIISQKQSDATLGYERVYDTDTGEIYKADLGFMDHDWNGKYEMVTDDMYNLPTSGYIEKR